MKHITFINDKALVEAFTVPQETPLPVIERISEKEFCEAGSFIDPVTQQDINDLF